jgi:hypothetical protein
LSGGAVVTPNGSITTNPLIVTVTSSSCPDYSVAASGSSTGTATILASGTNATVNVSAGGVVPPVALTIAPVNGFAGTVTFSASVVSTSGFTPTMTFNPASLTLSGSSSTSQTTTVNLSGVTASLQVPAMPGRPAPAGREWYAGSGVVVAGLFLLFVPQRRRLGSLLMVVLAIGVTAGVTGCGGGGQASVGTGNTTVNPYIGTYTVTVQAKYTSSGQTTTHSSVITYNIQ